MKKLFLSLLSLCLLSPSFIFCAEEKNANAELSEQAKAMGLSNEQLAKILSNPLANLIMLPFEFDWDYGGGLYDEGQQFYTKIQPVVPAHISDDFLLISRFIIPIESKSNMGYQTETGLGDISASFFLTPKADKSFQWGIGPIFLFPSATENHLGNKKWGAGPSVVMISQTEHWTLGLLASQVWSFAGDSSRPYINASYLQPFVAYHLPQAYTLLAEIEYTYDWNGKQSIFPINLMVSKVFKIGKMPISVGIGGRYYVDKPTGGPDWGVRLAITLVLPDFL